MNKEELTLLQDPDKLRALSRATGLLVAGVGGLVLLGWLFDFETLKSFVPGWSTMKSMTAVLFVLSGVCLSMLARGESRRTVPILAAIIALVSLLTLGEYLLNLDFGIDQILFRDPSSSSLTPGRMSPATAVAFFLIGLTLLSLDRTEARWVQDVALPIAFAIPSVALIGYLYGVSSLYRIGRDLSIAPHTALTMVLLALGILLARPERGILQAILQDTAGGYLLRRSLPVAFLLPILLGWLWMFGQRTGLFETALGLAFLVIALITAFGSFMWGSARQLTALDQRRRQADESWRLTETRFHKTLQSLTEGCQIIGFDWRYLYLNDAAIEHSQIPWENMIGRTVMECFPGIEDRPLFLALQRCMQDRIPADLVEAQMGLDGSRRWFEIQIEPSPDGAFVLSSDVTRRKQAEQALLVREMQLAKLLEILPVGISILDSRRQVIYSNPTLKKILHLTDDGFHNGAYSERTYIRADGTPMDLEELASSRAFREQKEIDDQETGIVMEDGSTVWTSVSAVPVNISDWRLVLVTADITARKQAEQQIRKLNLELEEKVALRTGELAAANEQLHQLAILDELTRLYNRRGFMLLAEEQLLLARRSKANLLVFFADLDGLKQINDRQGHEAGDEAIRTAAQALNKTFRSSDVKARLGGDEFIVLAIEAEGTSAPALMTRLEEQLAEQKLSMSVGVVTFDARKEASIDDLIAHADRAMYQVKRRRSIRS